MPKNTAVEEKGKSWMPVMFLSIDKTIVQKRDVFFSCINFKKYVRRCSCTYTVSYTAEFVSTPRHRTGWKSFSEIFPEQKSRDVKEPQISIRNLKHTGTAVCWKTNKLQLYLVRLLRANHNSSILLMTIVTMLGNCHWKPVRGYALVRRRYIAAVSRQTWTHNSGVRIWKFCNRIGSEVFS